MVIIDYLDFYKCFKSSTDANIEIGFAIARYSDMMINLYLNVNILWIVPDSRFHITNFDYNSINWVHNRPFQLEFYK